jgi:hypothetical protein
MSRAAQLRAALFVDVVTTNGRAENWMGPDQPAPRESVRRVKDGTRGVQEGFEKKDYGNMN